MSHAVAPGISAQSAASTHGTHAPSSQRAAFGSRQSRLEPHATHSPLSSSQYRVAGSQGILQVIPAPPSPPPPRPSVPPEPPSDFWLAQVDICSQFKNSLAQLVRVLASSTIEVQGHARVRFT